MRQRTIQRHLHYFARQQVCDKAGREMEHALVGGPLQLGLWMPIVEESH